MVNIGTLVVATFTSTRTSYASTPSTALDSTTANMLACSPF
jgi:hypothetical protein